MANHKHARGKRSRLPPNRGAAPTTAKGPSTDASSTNPAKDRPAVPKSSLSSSLHGPVDNPTLPSAPGSVDTGQSPLASLPHHFREGAARGTRSALNKKIDSAFQWEALEIQKSKEEADSPPSGAGKDKTVATHDMSRNRPRGPPVPRDNGLAANEETDMWNKIVQDLRKAKEKNDKQKELAEQIGAMNEKIARDGNSKYRLFASAPAPFLSFFLSFCI